MAQHRRRISSANAVSVENLARQIKAAATGVLVEIAQNVSELQRAAERVGNIVGSIARIAENMDREMADGACDARTVEVEPCEIGSANFLARVHLHAVDHGEKIAATQPIAQYWPTQRRADEVVRMSRIESIDLLAPGGEGGELVLDRPLAIGDVVDLAAKRIDRVHPVPAVPRQEAHRPI